MNQNHTLPAALIGLVALTGLSACHKPGEPPAEQPATNTVTAAPLPMPPAIKKSATLRCDDGSVVDIDFYADDKSASVKTSETGTATHVAAPDTTSPMTSTDGATIVVGHDSPVKLTLPGKSAQSCTG